MYNTEVFADTPPTSWNVVFEETTLPDGESNEGRVQAYDGPIYIADAALYLKATQPELGIEDPYALNQDQFDAVLDLFRDSQPTWSSATGTTRSCRSTTSPTRAVAVELVAVPGEPAQFDRSRSPACIPEEGATGWADTTMMHANAPHPNCAYKWMERSLDPKVQGDLAAWFGSVPAILAACAGNELLTDEVVPPTATTTSTRSTFWKTPQADCFGDGRRLRPLLAVDRGDRPSVAVIGGR